MEKDYWKVGTEIATMWAWKATWIILKRTMTLSNVRYNFSAKRYILDNGRFVKTQVWKFSSFITNAWWFSWSYVLKNLIDNTLN